MRKYFFSVLIFITVMLMATTALSNGWSDEAAFLASEEHLIVFDEYENSSESKAIIRSNKASSDLSLYAAAYQGDKLVAIKRTKLELSAGYNIINTGNDWSDIDKDMVKLFVWNDSANPYAEYEYEVLRPAQSKLSLFEVTANMPIQYNNSDAYRLTGKYNQRETIVILYNERGYGDTAPENFKAGDILYISPIDKNGVISYAENANVQKIEGVVTITPLCEIVCNGYDPSAEKTMVISGTDGTYALECSELENADDYLGKCVTAYAIDGKLCLISEKENYNTVVSINSSQLVTEGDRYYEDEFIIGYRENGETRVTALDLDSDVVTVVNYGDTRTDNVRTTADLAALLEGGNGKIKFISNDGDSVIDMILCELYYEESVVEEVIIEDNCITFGCYIGSIEDFNLADEDMFSSVIKDGEKASITDIAKGDVVSKLDTGDDCVVIYRASSEFVEGTVDGYDDEFVEINDKEYRLSPLSLYAHPSKLAEITGKFYLNVCGEIAFDEPVREGQYALVLAAGTTPGINGGYEIEVVLENGTTGIYPLATNTYVEDENGNLLTEETYQYANDAKSDDATYAYFEDFMSEDGAAYRITAEDITDSVFEITIKNEKVIKLVKLDTGATAGEKVYDEENMCYGAVCFDEDTVVMSVDAMGTTKVQADDIVVGKVADFFTDGEGGVEITAYDEDNNDIAGFVIGYGLAAAVLQDGDALFITSVMTKEIDNEDAFVVTGMQVGEEGTYTLYDIDETFVPDDIKQGDVILLEDANAEGIVKDLEME